jgi:HPt (histidine-containing phosphotransfer) domain-containing protein
MLDKTKALADLEMSEDEYDEMLQAFVGLADEQIQGLESALASGNDTDARELAHSLKGAAGNLRLDDCLAIASAIELALKEQRKDRFREQLDALIAAVDEVRVSGG